MTQHNTYTDENGRIHDYTKYSTEKLISIWNYCPDRKITDIVEKELEERGVRL